MITAIRSLIIMCIYIYIYMVIRIYYRERDVYVDICVYRDQAEAGGA